MQLVQNLTELPQLKDPCGLTIGSFDGVHLGHQCLVNHLKSLLPHHAKKVVLTFSNHPSHMFCPQSPVPLIYSPEQKTKTLFEIGANLVIMIPFTKAFSEIPFEEFLLLLKEQLNFSYLVLGKGSTFGKNKQGNETHVKNFCEKFKITALYLEKLESNAHPVSSGRIRKAIQSGDFKEASQCLGRRYSLMGKLVLEKDNFLIRFNEPMCLPPSGSYSVDIETKYNQYKAICTIEQESSIVQLMFKERSWLPSNETIEIFF